MCFLCKNCNEVTCPECFEVDHKGHERANLRLIYEEQRSELVKSSVSLNSHTEAFGSTLTVFRDQISEVKSDHKERLKQIADFNRHLRMSASFQSQSQLMRLTTVADEQIIQKIDELTSIKDQIDKVVNRDSMGELVSRSEQLAKLASEAKQAETPDVQKALGMYESRHSDYVTGFNLQKGVVEDRWNIEAGIPAIVDGQIWRVQVSKV